jgi:hypothetical protein
MLGNGWTVDVISHIFKNILWKLLLIQNKVLHLYC